MANYKNNDKTKKTGLSLFDTGSMSALTEVLFMERCLRLLKKGGRMGIVLPEGVLNTSNLRKIREYFEGRAKLVLITSIPQDVFIAAGATVKPSLVFMKRFTEAEEKQYSEIKEKAENEVKENLFLKEWKGLQKELDDPNTDKKRQRQIADRIKIIEAEIIEKAKPLIKKYFDYEIPIAKVDKAGITSTGAVCENELTLVRDEFRDYFKTNALWEVRVPLISYEVLDDGHLIRNKNGTWETLG
jgi:type I restriction enzyme M protein